MKDILQSQNSSIPLQGLFCYPYGIYVYPVPPPYIQACQLFQEAGEQIIKQEVKEEYESESIQEVRKKKIVKFSPYIYPGETKTIIRIQGRNYHHSLLIVLISRQQNRTHLQSNLQKSKAKITTGCIFRNYSNQSWLGGLLENFWKFLWCSRFIQQNKTDIDLYLRHNQLMYQRKKNVKAHAEK